MSPLLRLSERQLLHHLDEELQHAILHGLRLQPLHKEDHRPQISSRHFTLLRRGLYGRLPDGRVGVCEAIHLAAVL